mmetsp:Transcript_25894/g.60472  ORF Transcript_25894/g.60472 Transcript_25894/m.60472 type:complete len:88 (+) Transcript_25894:181-444(+)
MLLPKRLTGRPWVHGRRRSRQRLLLRPDVCGVFSARSKSNGTSANSSTPNSSTPHSSTPDAKASNCARAHNAQNSICHSQDSEQQKL